MATFTEPIRRIDTVDLLCDRPLVCLDTETTGVVPERDRIIEIALKWMGDLVDYDTTHEWLVRPDVPIPAEATAVHGITDAMVALAPRFADIADEVVRRIEGVALLGFNIGFDLQMLDAELARIGHRYRARTDQRPVIDAFAIFRQREPRSLEAAVRFYCGREHQGHRAGSDVEATVDVLRAQLARYRDLPGNAAALAEYCLQRDPSWFDDDGKLRWQGDEVVINFGKNKGRALRELARNDQGFLWWIVQRDFSDAVKAVVRDAIAGKFPTKAGG